MPASPQDFYKKVGANTVTTLAAPGKNLAATSINVGATTNYPTDTGIVVGIRVVDSNGTIVPGTYTEWNAVVASSTAITIEAVPVYGTDQVYPAGSLTQVFLMVSSSLHNQMVDGLLVSHDQDGKLKAGAISNSNMFANSVIPTAAITDASVTAAKTDFGGDYSTSEVDTGFKWVDNKTIFKKTISTGALPNNTAKTVAHGISTFDFAIHTYGHAKSSGGITRPLPYPGTSTNYVGIFVDATNVTLSTTSDLTTYSVSYVTLIYVKT